MMITKQAVRNCVEGSGASEYHVSITLRPPHPKFERGLSGIQVTLVANVCCEAR
jgi:hypothetical protein